MLIDIHTHIFSEKHYADYLKRGGSGVDRVLTIHDADLSEPGKVAVTQEELIAFTKGKSNISVIASTEMTKELDPQLKKIDAWFRAGDIVGVKLYPGYQPFYVSDPRVDPIADLCAQYKKPLVIHTGDVYDPEGNARLIYSHPIHVDELAGRHRDCPIVIAHFGLPHILETANIVSKNKNVYTDISGALTDMPPADAERLREQFVVDLKRAFAYFPDVRRKTLFGTDYAGEHTYLNQVEPYLRVVEAVWSGEERDLMTSGLAQQLFF